MSNLSSIRDRWLDPPDDDSELRYQRWILTNWDDIEQWGELDTRLDASHREEFYEGASLPDAYAALLAIKRVSAQRLGAQAAAIKRAKENRDARPSK